jgi:hypothetical protein
MDFLVGRYVADKKRAWIKRVGGLRQAPVYRTSKIALARDVSAPARSVPRITDVRMAALACQRQQAVERLRPEACETTRR